MRPTQARPSPPLPQRPARRRPRPPVTAPHAASRLGHRCDNLDLQDFNIERWTAIVTYKTAFYSFYLSVAFAMVYAGTAAG